MRAGPSGVLGRESLRRLVSGPEPLVDGLRDPEAQLQPNGVDLTVEALWQLTTGGSLGGPPPGRRLPGRTPVEPSIEGWYSLGPGTYVVTLHERVRLPVTLMALAFPRSTLLRCGAHLYTAVFDAGYHGQPEALLVVENHSGIELGVAAAICQLVFLPLSEAVEGYRGAYQEKFFTVTAGGESLGGSPEASA